MSAIIATILIILITVAAVAIVWGLVIPLIQNGSWSGGYDADVAIDTDGGYTYFDSEKGVACVQIKRGAGDANLSRIDVLFVYDGTTLDDKGNFSGVEIPGVNEMKQKCFNLTRAGSNKDRTEPPYVAPDSIKIVPVYSDGTVGEVTSTVPSNKISSGNYPGGPSIYSVGGCKSSAECGELEICVDGGVCVPSPVVESVIPQDYVAYWKFDEGVGSIVADQSGNHNGGLWTSYVWVDSPRAGGGSVDFNSGYMDITNPDALYFSSNDDYTWAGWFEIDSSKQYNPVFSSQTYTSCGGGNAGYFIGESNGNFGMYNSYSCESVTYPVSAGWNHFVITYNSGNVKLFINGVKVNEGSSYFKSYSYWSYIGLSYAYEFLDGKVDEIIFYNRELSESEAEGIYNFY